jgi:phage shock protein A
MSSLYNQEVMDVIATLEQEIKQVRARNERLEKEYDELEKQYYTLKEQCDLFKRQIGIESGRVGCCKDCD